MIKFLKFSLERRLECIIVYSQSAAEDTDILMNILKGVGGGGMKGAS